MTQQLKMKLAFVVFFFVSSFTQAQDFFPVISEGMVQTEFKVEKHVWINGDTFQFVAVSTTGLPDVNTIYSTQSSDSFSISRLPDLVASEPYGGGYGPPIPFSRNQTFQPIKTLKEVVYDSISATNKIRHTSLFLLDDFDAVKNGETLIIKSRGCFGYHTRSHANCDDFTTTISFSKSLLHSGDSCPIANSAWYREWLTTAPKSYSDARRTNQYGELHKYFDFYLKGNWGKN